MYDIFFWLHLALSVQSAVRRHAGESEEAQMRISTSKSEATVPCWENWIVSCHVGYESLHSCDADSPPPKKSLKYNAIMCKQTVSWYVPDATFITQP